MNKKYRLLGGLPCVLVSAIVLIGGNDANGGVTTTVDPGRRDVSRHFASTIDLPDPTVDFVQVTFEDMKFLKVSDNFLYFTMSQFGSPPGGGNSHPLRTWGFLGETGTPIYTRRRSDAIATEYHSLGTPVARSLRVYGFFATWDPEVFVRAGKAQVAFEFALDVTVGGPPIDIRPRSKENIIHRSSNREIWVAILSDTSVETPFDPLSQVDVTTVRFGPSRAAPIEQTVRDVNHDGLPELLILFNIRETGIRCGMKSARLTARTFDGGQFAGSDFVQVVDCKQPH